MSVPVRELFSTKELDYNNLYNTIIRMGVGPATARVWARQVAITWAGYNANAATLVSSALQQLVLGKLTTAGLYQTALTAMLYSPERWSIVGTDYVVIYSLSNHELAKVYKPNMTKDTPPVVYPPYKPAPTTGVRLPIDPVIGMCNNKLYLLGGKLQTVNVGDPEVPTTVGVYDLATDTVSTKSVLGLPLAYIDTNGSWQACMQYGSPHVQVGDKLYFLHRACTTADANGVVQLSANTGQLRLPGNYPENYYMWQLTAFDMSNSSVQRFSTLLHNPVSNLVFMAGFLYYFSYTKYSYLQLVKLNPVTGAAVTVPCNFSSMTPNTASIDPKWPDYARTELIDCIEIRFASDGTKFIGICNKRYGTASGVPQYIMFNFELDPGSGYINYKWLGNPILPYALSAQGGVYGYPYQLRSDVTTAQNSPVHFYGGYFLHWNRQYPVDSTPPDHAIMHIAQAYTGYVLDVNGTPLNVDLLYVNTLQGDTIYGYRHTTPYVNGTYVFTTEVAKYKLSDIVAANKTVTKLRTLGIDKYAAADKRISLKISVDKVSMMPSSYKKHFGVIQRLKPGDVPTKQLISMMRRFGVQQNKLRL